MSNATFKTVPVYRFPTGCGSHTDIVPVAEETAVNLIYGGIPYAVMMATPRDLEDFAYGFSLSERVVESGTDIAAVSVKDAANGIALDIALRPGAFSAFLRNRRKRNLNGKTSCGVCGVEELADMRQRPIHPELSATQAGTEAIFKACRDLRELQILSQKTRCAHAAAWANTRGAIVDIREDVGRHNALDKVIGSRLRDARGGDGFCLVTSRCSYEMAEKAALAGIAILVAMSAPTALAIEVANTAGLTLAVAGRTELCVYTHHFRILDNGVAVDKTSVLPCIDQRFRKQSLSSHAP